MRLEITLKQFNQIAEECNNFKMELQIEEATVTAIYNMVDGLDWEITKGEWKLDTPFEDLYELPMLVEEADKLYLIL